MADLANAEGSEGKLEDKPGGTDNDQAKNISDTPRNDRFKVRQVGFTSPENPTTNPEEKNNDDNGGKEELNVSDETPIEPQSPGREHFTHGYATNEALPMTIFYRSGSSQTKGAKQRPTIQELRKGLDSDSPFQVSLSVFWCGKMAKLSVYIS